MMNQFVRFGLYLNLFITGGASLAQGDEEVKNFQLMYLNAGGLIFPCLGCEGGGSEKIFTGSVSYERNKNRDFSAIRYTAGFGTYSGEKSVHLSVSGVLLTGKRKGHFEADYGIMYNGVLEPALFPLLNLGYRYQDFEKDGLIYRVGLGTEVVGFYMSLGKSF